MSSVEETGQVTGTISAAVRAAQQLLARSVEVPSPVGEDDFVRLGGGDAEQ